MPVCLLNILRKSHKHIHIQSSSTIPTASYPVSGVNFKKQLKKQKQKSLNGSDVVETHKNSAATFCTLHNGEFLKST